MRILSFLFAGLCVVLLGQAQAPAVWEKDIKAFEAEDQQTPPETGGVLFVGSSTIRFWGLAKHFPEAKALNRGFGGSTVADVLQYFDRVVLPYKPKTIVFYSGDNDVKNNPDADKVFADFESLFTRIARDLPETRTIVLGIKASKARWELYPVMKTVNEKIAAYANTHPRLKFVETESLMLNPGGQVREELLREDGLHLNELGYVAWTTALKLVLFAKE